MSAEQKLKELHLELPPAPTPIAVYKPLVIDGHIAYVSGHGPVQADGSLMKGRLGEDMDQQAGYDAARQVGLTMLATLKKQLGSLDRVKRVIKLLGLVNSTADFDQQPAVINGCSELFVKVFGDEAGISARSAIGTNTLPGKIPVEIEGIFEITD